MDKSLFDCIVKTADHWIPLLDDATTATEKRVILVAAMNSFYAKIKENQNEGCY